MSKHVRSPSRFVDKNVVLNSSSTFWNLWMIHYLSVCAMCDAHCKRTLTHTHTLGSGEMVGGQPTPNKRPMTAWTWCKSSFYYNEPVSESRCLRFSFKWCVFSFDFFFPSFYCWFHCANACFILNYSTFNWLFYKRKKKRTNPNMHYTYGVIILKCYFPYTIRWVVAIAVRMRIARGLLGISKLKSKHIFLSRGNLLWMHLGALWNTKLFIGRSERKRRSPSIAVEALHLFLGAFTSVVCVCTGL